MRLFVRTILCLIVGITVSPLSLNACSRPPGYGFILSWVFEDETGPFPVFTNISGASLSGNFVSGQGSTAGSQTAFSDITDSSGLLSELGKATPATWQIGIHSGPCSPSEPSINGNTINKFFLPSSSPQQLVCELIETSSPDSLASSPASYDTSAGPFTYTMTVTDNSEAWPRTPATWYNYDAYGDVMQWGSVGGVTDSYNCWMYYEPFFDNNHGSAIQYIWLTDGSGLGIGYATLSVTNGSGGGG